MTLDPGRLAEIGERHVRDGRDEADFRTALNRLYYACHLTARDQLYGIDAERMAARGDRRPSHRAVLEAVAEALSPEVGDALRHLRRMREAADYIRDSSHPEVQEVMTWHGVRDWSGLARIGLEFTHDLLPLLRAMPPADL